MVNEKVLRGLLFALGAIPIGLTLSLVLWQAGFIASLSSYLLAVLAVRFYRKGATTIPKKGGYLLVGVILVGLLFCLLSGIIADGWSYYNQHHLAGEVGFGYFLIDNLSSPELWGSYGSTIAFSLAFAALGSYRVLKGVFSLSKG